MSLKFHPIKMRQCFLSALPLLASGLLFNAASVAAADCQPDGKPVLLLRVVAGEMTSADPALTISLHGNDCVRIHMPAHYRRRGDYAITLNATERAEIENLSRVQQAAPYTHADMLTEAAEIETRSVRGEELFAVLDADYIELTRRDGEAVTTTRALGLFQYAERYPQIESLKALQQIAQALIALSRRDDLIAVDAASAGLGSGQ